MERELLIELINSKKVMDQTKVPKDKQWIYGLGWNAALDDLADTIAKKKETAWLKKVNSKENQQRRKAIEEQANG